MSNYHNEIIWNNSNIRVGQTAIFYKEWFRLGIKHIKDIYDQENQRYYCFYKLQEKFNQPPIEFLSHMKVRKTAKIRERYNHVLHLTQDTTWESNKTTKNITYKSQEVSPFPAGDHKAAMNRRVSMANTRHT